MAPISALSHLTLAAPNKRLHEESLDFYHRLGFKTISQETDDVWLHLFPPSSAKHGAGFTLHLIVDNVPTFDENTFQREWKKTADSLTDDKVGYASWGCFVVDDVQVIQAELDKTNYPYKTSSLQYSQLWTSQRVTSHSHITGPASETPQTAAVALQTYDPLGNLLTFTNRASPFGTGKVDAVKVSQTSLASIATVDGIPDASTEEGERRQRKRIGILTSGGDSSGMNAAVRSITRVALQRGCVPFAIYEGYQGLVDGGNYIKRLGWEDVRSLLAVGGTSIGTARCADFRTREGRLKAVYNLITNGIDALVVIGGDGSLTGADMLRAEWKGLVDELVSAGKLKAEDCQHLREDLTIVGMVGSIDNDMSSTDITIGAVTSLHRICEAVDNLTSTALSHQRAFVVEVMGRHCGWLGLMAGIAVGADWVFLPERPPPLDDARYGDDWETEMCDTIKKYRSRGNRKSLVIVCEGAIDRQLNPIKADYVQKVLTERLHLDTRVTCLGHVQRGGTPCAYDRFLATVQGVEAVEAVLRSKPGVPAPMIGISHNKITAVPLMEAVQLTHAVGEAIKKKDFARAMELRDPSFTAIYDAFLETTIFSQGNTQPGPDGQRLRIGIIHTGAPAGGMNAATRTAARLCLNRGHIPIGIRNGFSGLIRDEVAPLKWNETVGWQVRGGSELGTNRDHPQPLPGGPKIAPKGDGEFVDLGLIAYHMQKHDIQALLIVGGFEAYTAQLTLTHARSVFPAFCIPMIQLPATVSNNVPGTDYSIGSDTALNAIVEACDRIKLSANASRKRVFVVEVQGGNCGYLATLGGLTTGATTVYIPEEGVNIDKLQSDIRHLCKRYTEEDRWGIRNEGRVILRSEMASSTYTTDVISNILRAEGNGLFDSRTAVLGHLQQGGVPSPLDRIRATHQAVNCVNWLEKAVASAREALAHLPVPGASSVYTKQPSHSCIIGIVGADTVYTPVEDILKEADVKARRGKDQWWMGFNRLIRILSKYEYSADVVDTDKVDLLRNRDPSRTMPKHSHSETDDR
ncbi:6-phosphofructokinase [Spizellomyces sp. 'palustris']|nr:6-phosphofructokinase [Spizellomyces sp. 'palustris']